MLVLLGIGSMYLYRDASSRTPTIQFYGQVVDEEGNAVAGAQVDASSFQRKENFLIPGSKVRARNTEKRIAVTTDLSGRFEIVSYDGDELHFNGITKPGYEWVIDWAWTASLREFDNRYYIYDENRIKGVYTADQARPAIFPMHAVGSPKATTRPSRGGADWNGVKAVPNESVAVVIPSAGPDAPTTPAEINERIRALPPKNEILRQIGR